jgi:hypothetical protein
MPNVGHDEDFMRTTRINLMVDAEEPSNALLLIPDELLATLGWKVGDVLTIQSMPETRQLVLAKTETPQDMRADDGADKNRRHMLD